MASKNAAVDLDPASILTPAKNHAIRFAVLAGIQGDQEAVLLRKSEVQDLARGINQLKDLCEALLAEKKIGASR